jgi:hypothetical protein
MSPHIDSKASCAPDASFALVSNLFLANELFTPCTRHPGFHTFAGRCAPLQGAGSLHSKQWKMVGALGDPYSEVMPPSQFRRGLQQPLPEERNYLVTQ